MPVTIRDVAKAAGVSVTTASHAFSDQGRVAADTRRHVRRVADELGFTANVHAQRLASGRSWTVAIQIARSASPGSTHLLPDSAFFSGVLNGAARVAEERGYTMVLAPPGASESRVATLGIQGAVIVDPIGDEPMFRLREKHGTPLVTIGRPMDVEPPPPAVDNDHQRAAAGILDHLRSNGYQRTALLTTDGSRSYTGDLVHGLRSWLRRHGGDEIIVEIPGQPSATSAAAVTKRLLAGPHPPDSVFTTYDRLALGALHQARLDQVAVPEELGIVSAVDSDALQWASVPITGLDLNQESIGSRAMQLLLDQIEDIPTPSELVTVSTRLVPRASTTRRPPAA
jgi:DNA-binding LacI/PurR family transcriptional regulator